MATHDGENVAVSCPCGWKGVPEDLCRSDGSITIRIPLDGPAVNSQQFCDLIPPMKFVGISFDQEAYPNGERDGVRHFQPIFRQVVLRFEPIPPNSQSAHARSGDSTDGA